MIETLQGQLASRLGFASQYTQDATCIRAAFEAGINYFFDYQLPQAAQGLELKSLLATNREAIIYTFGSESRSVRTLRQQLDEVRQQLDISWVDIFFLEYLSPADDVDEIKAAIAELNDWKAQGLIRYVGVTTHHRPTGIAALEQRSCDVLMHRYNMAHRKAEDILFPAAQAAEIPVVAFTATRWGTLLSDRPARLGQSPTAAECYRFALHHPAVAVALTSPANRIELAENVQVLHKPPLSLEEVARWQAYGDWLYGDGQSTFETQYP